MNIFKDTNKLNRNTIKVIFICSPVRSGSTYLQAMLSMHSDLVGLGEVSRVVKLANESRASEFFESVECTCGESSTKCAFWSKIFDIKKQRKINRVDVLNTFSRIYPNACLVDSSKNLDNIDFYIQQKNVDLKVLHLVRDFRGWALSVDKYQRKSNQNIYGKTLNILINSYRWLYTTKKRMRYLDETRTNYLNISYENLIFDSVRQKKRIGKFLEIDNSMDVLKSFTLKNTHELLGNSSLKESHGQDDSIRYDIRWFFDLRLFLIGFLVIPVYLYNLRFVRKFK